MQPAYKEHSNTGLSDRSQPIAMVDTLGLPYLVCSYFKDVMENPAIADWFFYHHIQKFIEAFILLTFCSHSVHKFYSIFVQLMKFPIFVFGLVHFTSPPFINNAFTVVM